MAHDNFRLIKNSQNEFYLLGPGLLKVRVTGSVEEAWEKLNAELAENKKFFQEAGLDDESGTFNMQKAFSKNFWLENLVRSSIMMIPMLLGFILFSSVLTSQISKLSGKIKDALEPNRELSIRSQEGFKKTLDHYRPYVHETLKMWQEEERKVKNSGGK